MRSTTRLLRPFFVNRQTSTTTTTTTNTTNCIKDVRYRSFHNSPPTLYYTYTSHPNKTTTHSPILYSLNNGYDNQINRAFKRTMFVHVQSTPNPDSLKFVPGVTVMEKGTMEFPDARSTSKSPLAKALFKLDGVTRVFFARDFISVNKEVDQNWANLKPAVFGVIVDFYNSGKPIFEEEQVREDTQVQPGDSEVVQMIKEILETRIRPQVQEDGGDIEYKGFENGVVLLKMQGSCSGCASSSVTLKHGIERMLTHFVPEVTGVVAVSDNDLEKINLDQFNKTNSQIEQQTKH